MGFKHSGATVFLRVFGLRSNGSHAAIPGAAADMIPCLRLIEVIHLFKGKAHSLLKQFCYSVQQNRFCVVGLLHISGY
jgi:hypothetical protein